MHNLIYPFAAILGQEQAKRALMLNLVNPRIGGVLLCGEKGTAKSTLVRSAAALSGKKVVELPLNATEDMLIGSIDFEATVKNGERRFAGGILERANGNILYVDEINLLSDSIASAVVSAAAAGENLVEREGISYRHDCSFILIGTMNPEEGGLRPQMLDKFGLYVGVSGEQKVEHRMEIIRRRMDYEKDPAGFCEAYEAERKKLEKIIADAVKILPQVRAEDTICRLAGKMVTSAFCEGNRAEVVLIETACAAAALDQRIYVTVADLKEAAEYVLPHRQREASDNLPESIDKESQEQKEEDPSEESENSDGERSSEEAGENIEDSKEDSRECGEEDGEKPYEEPSKLQEDDRLEPSAEELVEGEEIYQIIRLPGDVRDRLKRKGSGRRRRTNSSTNKGRYAGFSMDKGKGSADVALDATLRAAAPFQKDREKKSCAIAIEDSDIRYKRRESHVGATIIFVVDASGSMSAAKRMKETKEAVLSMLMDSYQKRDRIGLIAFRQKKAEVLLGITSSVDLAQKELQSLPTGGRTPLADGIYRAWELLQAGKRKDPEMLPLLVLITDGRANSPLWGEDPVEDALKAAEMVANEKIPAIVVDTEQGFLSFHLAEKIAAAMKADYFKVNELRSTQLEGIVSLNREQLMQK